jgi:hypothetical protein
LEKKNPTVEPALSPLLNGVWELVFASGLSTPGIIGFEVFFFFFWFWIQLFIFKISILNVLINKSKSLIKK